MTDGTIDEREHLIDSAANSSGPNSSGWVSPDPFICFSSKSVGYRSTYDGSFSSGSLSLVRRDSGGQFDYNSIELYLEWKGRGEEETTKHVLSVDDFISFRVLPPAVKPILVLQQVGGSIWGCFEFSAGPPSLKSLERALKENAVLIPLSDAFRDGRLVAVDAKPRMRVAVPRITDDFGGSSNTRPPIRTPSSSSGDFGMMILENFAKVTQFTRRTVAQAVEKPAQNRAREDRRRRIREDAARLGATDLSAEIVPSTEDESALPPRLLLDKQRGIAVTSEVWESHLDSSGRLHDPAMFRHAVYVGGLEKDTRSIVWPILLGVLNWDIDTEGRKSTLAAKHGEYMELRGKWEAIRKDAKDWAEANQAGTVVDSELPSKSLSDYMQSAEQIAKDITRTDRIVDIFAPDDSVAARVMSDLLNMYAYYDKKIQYCQGMSDFMSQIVYHIAPEGGEENESVAFWCFEALMKRIECNFRIDQSGMHSQLGRLQRVVKKMDSNTSKKLWPYFEETDPDMYTCFRWILVRFKRELSYTDTSKLWDVLWTRHVGGDMLHIYVAAGLLFAHRERILNLPPTQFDSLLRYINDLSGRLDADFMLREGELLLREVGVVE